MVDQRADGGRQAASRCEDEVHDALQPSPGGQHTDKSSRLYRFSADVIGKDRHTEPVHGGVAYGRHVFTSQTRLDPNDVLAAVFHLEMPFDIIGDIVGRQRRKRGELCIDFTSVAEMARRSAS
jgi:hypothetical protein